MSVVFLLGFLFFLFVLLQVIPPMVKEVEKLASQLPTYVNDFPNSGRLRSRKLVAVPRITTPSMIWTIWKAAIGSISCRVRLGGRGIAWPFQVGALQPCMIEQRLSVLGEHATDGDEQDYARAKSRSRLVSADMARLLGSASWVLVAWGLTAVLTLTAALSGTVGLGNIAGVAVAITLGGPGATFWMILAGLLGMTTKFTECTLGQQYREVRPDGRIMGGAMFYLSKGLGELGMPRLGKSLAVMFAILCIGGSLAGGNAFQSLNHSRFITLSLQPADKPRAGVRKPFVIEIDGVLCGQHHAETKSPTLLQ